jgi:hypothetical protein
LKILLGDFNTKVDREGILKPIIRNENLHYHVVLVKLRQRPAVNKQRSNRYHMESFNLKKLNETEGKEHHHIDVSNRFATSEDFIFGGGGGGY